MDVIEIQGLRLRCVLGIRAEERCDRQDVVIDLTVGTDATPAELVDSVESVWNYRTATKAVIALVEASDYYTVEKLAGEVAQLLVVEHGAPFVRVRVRKQGALRFADAVGVTIERGFAHYAGGVGEFGAAVLPVSGGRR